MSKLRSSVLLDIDTSIIENNLLLDETKERSEEFEKLFPDLAEAEIPSKLVRPRPGFCIKLRKTDETKERSEEFEKLFPDLAEAEIPSKLVRPRPGFCIKLRKTDESKVFINVCHTDAIPAPSDISEQRLTEILSSDDPSDFRVPMSIGNPRQEPDKSGISSDVYDVAVNEVFFQKLEKSITFRCFFLRVAFEGVQNKFEIELKPDEFVVLKNRKAMGTLQQHRIQQRDVKSTRPPRLLIEEVAGGTSASAKPPPPPPGLEATSRSPMAGRRPTDAWSDRGSGAGDTALARTVHTTRTPTYRLIADPASGPVARVIAEVRLPDVATAKEISLDVGEDRIIVEARRKGYLLDVFLPYRMDEQACCAQFNQDTGLLTVTVPAVEV